MAETDVVLSDGRGVSCGVSLFDTDGAKEKAYSVPLGQISDKVVLGGAAQWSHSLPVVSSFRAFCRFWMAVPTSSYCSALPAYLQYF